MNSEKILESARVLELHDRASLQEIKDAYREKLYRWHPDRCKEDPELCGDMTKKIIEAYAVIMEYCNNHRYHFTEAEIRKSIEFEDPDAFWARRFGNDPYWGATR